MTHHAATPERRGRVAYTRFVVGTERESPRLQTGVIAELRLLRETGNLTMRESRCVGELFDWFNQHLPQPPFVSSNWPEDAISWFKPGGQAYVDKLEEMIAILAGYDLPIRILRTFDPGVIHYEDDFQVVASSPHY